MMGQTPLAGAALAPGGYEPRPGPTEAGTGEGTELVPETSSVNLRLLNYRDSGDLNSRVVLRVPQRPLMLQFKCDPPISSASITVGRDNLARLLAAGLYNLGYGNAAAELERESGFYADSSLGRDFTAAVCAGAWELAVEMLPQLLLPPLYHSEVLLTIYEQQYLEFIEAGDWETALYLLRNRIGPAFPFVHQLAHYTELLLSQNLEATRKSLGYSAFGPSNSEIPLGMNRRRLIMQYIQNYVSTDIFAPGDRLEELLRQSLCAQIMTCPSHSESTEDMDFFENHVCDKSLFPAKILRRYEEHGDEVLHISFSNDGTRLASAGKDCSVRLYNMDHILDARSSAYFVLSLHTGWIQSCSWSPDDRMLISVSNDTTFCLWDTNTGSLRFRQQQHKMTVTSCAWFRDGQRFATGSLDKTIVIWSIDGTILSSVRIGRVDDIKISPDGGHIYVNCCDTLRVISVDKMREAVHHAIHVPEGLHAMSLSSDGRYMLCSMANTNMHLWLLQTRELVAKYLGTKPGPFQLRCTFGGPLETLVASGSHDHNVYVWHRVSQRRVGVLRGHSAPVTCVAWNPKQPNILASCSDDHSIIIWAATTSAENVGIDGPFSSTCARE